MTLEETIAELRGTIAELQVERDEFARRTKESEDIRAAMFVATQQVSADMVRALTEIQELQKVVDAVVQVGKDLQSAINGHTERVKARS